MRLDVVPFGIVFDKRVLDLDVVMPIRIRLEFSGAANTRGLTRGPHPRSSGRRGQHQHQGNDQWVDIRVHLKLAGNTMMTQILGVLGTRRRARALKRLGSQGPGEVGSRPAEGRGLVSALYPSELRLPGRSVFRLLMLRYKLVGPHYKCIHFLALLRLQHLSERPCQKYKPEKEEYQERSKDHEQEKADGCDNEENSLRQIEKPREQPSPVECLYITTHRE